MAKVEIRTTMQPDKPIRINEDDVPQIRHQGILLGEPVPVQPAATPAAQPQATAAASKGARNRAKPVPSAATPAAEPQATAAATPAGTGNADRPATEGNTPS